ncbi:hypothetical protein J3R82DRAFT_91 [Butyriboletus roseoflavus]|nr:hypothetical protein J3R82DRAFT_91 [Butyriboletus roseoflavus]
MLHQLPPEVALHTISYLPLHSLYSTTLISRDWNALIATNEPTVYRNAAILHRFIDEDQLGAGSIPINWKAYCRRQLEIERGWRGKAPSAVRELTATGTVVHRIKVDYELGLVITTRQTGGISVCDIKTNRILWALPPDHAVRYAHCEYDRGYIIFNRYDNCKEVWRRTVDADGHHSETSPPDKKMLEASTQAAANYHSAENRWAHFKAWALLRMPENTRAFRFSYPTLLAVATNNAYLWDVPRSQLVSVVRDVQRLYHGLLLAAINYVEVNDLYVFICGGGGLRIFAREGGALLYQLPTRELTSAAWDVLPRTPGLTSSVVHPQMLLSNCRSLCSSHGEFMACHVSASGNDLAVLVSNGRLVILPDFQRLFAGSNSVHHRDIAIILNFQPPSSDEEISRYLAVGGRNGKLVIATWKGIYVISPTFDFDRLTADRPPEPGVSVCRLSKFDNDHLLNVISCLQITHDAIYFTYKPSYTNGAFNTTHRAHVHDIGVHDPADDVEEFPIVADEVEVEDWEDEDSEDEDPMGMGAVEEDPVHAIINNWFLPTSSNTVYSVSF